MEGFRACDYTTMWYNGPYLMEEFIQGNTKSFIPKMCIRDSPAPRRGGPGSSR